ncbi:hypothetical protein Btru_039812 [Bulinus truncatus]|nr:hypothetical protein Btru_039812 [Bulinus truncatus]
MTSRVNRRDPLPPYARLNPADPTGYLKRMGGVLLLSVAIGLADLGGADMSTVGPLQCQRGTFLKHEPGGPSACLDCPSGTFMDQGPHKNLGCKPCTVYDKHIDSVQEASPCTKVSDSRIMKCVPGFYLVDRKHEYGCWPCRFCHGGVGCCEDASTLPPTDRPITSTVGRISASVTAAATEHTSTRDHPCVEHVVRLNGCLSGEFWNASCGDGNDPAVFHCAKCPAGGTHTPEGYHRETSCGSSSSSSMSTILIAVPVSIISALLIAGLVVLWAMRRRRRRRRHAKNLEEVEESQEKVQLNNMADIETVGAD